MKRILLLAIFGVAGRDFADGQVVKRVCQSGCDYALNQIQQAVDDAQPGWIIEIQAGQTATTVTGLILRKKNGSDGTPITIRGSGLPNLTPGARVTPADAPNLARITYTFPGYVTMLADQGAAYYTFAGIEFTNLSGSFVENMIKFGTDANGGIADSTIEQLAHDMVFDQCYIHGYPGQDGPRRAIAANMGALTVTNSWISDIKSVNSEGTAIGGWNVVGPIYIRNNHISSSAITTMFGGAPPNIRGIRATNLTFQGNHYYRPWIWRSTSGVTNPSGACLFDANGGEYYQNTSVSTFWNCVGGVWTQIPQASFSAGYFNKNQFELKNASKAEVEGNLLENGWLPAFQSQRGAAFLMNQVDNSSAFDGFGEPAAVVEHVMIHDNIARNMPWGVSTGALGVYFTPMHDIVYDNNLFSNMGAEPQSQGDNKMLQTTGTGRFRFSQNTTIANRASGGVAVGMDAPVTNGMEFYGNIIGWNEQGLYNSFDSSGSLWNAFDGAWAPNRALSKNVVVNNQHALAYGVPAPIKNLQTPSDNTGLIPCSSCSIPEYFDNGGTNDVGFTNFSAGDYRLSAASRYKRWSHGGADAGADIDSVTRSTAHAEDGQYNAFLDFKIRDLTVTASGAAVRYTAYDANACVLTASGRPDLVAPVATVNDGGGDLDRFVPVTGLNPNTRYYFQLVCGSAARKGNFLTRP